VIRLTLPSGRSIRIVTAPVVLATKLEAFRGRGRGDYLISHDLAAQFRELLNTSAFLEALPAFLPTGSGQSATTAGFAGDPEGDHGSGRALIANSA
jgi:hypothetical protein